MGGLFEEVFCANYLHKVGSAFRSSAPARERPAPAKYQDSLESCALSSVGTSYTEELLLTSGMLRMFPSDKALDALLQHYADRGDLASISTISLIPMERLISSHIAYRSDLPFQSFHISADRAVQCKNESNQCLYKAKLWREPVDAERAWRPILLSSFYFENMISRLGHTEFVALEGMVFAIIAATTSGKWLWRPDFWEQLEGEVALVVTHAPCPSCLGASVQLHAWAPQLQIRFACADWTEWHGNMISF